MEQLDLAGLIRNDDSKRRQLDNEIQAKEGQQLSIRQEMEQAYGLLKIKPDLGFVADKLANLEGRSKELERQLSQKKVERQELDVTDTAFYESKDEIRSLISRLQTTDAKEADLYKLRAQVSDRIRDLVGTLHLAPVGYVSKGSSVKYEVGGKFEATDLNAAVAHVMQIGKDQRYFLVGFKNGDVLAINPKRDDPPQFDMKVIALPGQGIIIHDGGVHSS